uniref:Uncharacterized protein n=1 Tax=Acrobeloides nanus TaxID=290746 RepID=A0A914DQY3_9BILA
MHDKAIGIDEIRREIDISLNIRNYLGIDDQLSTGLLFLSFLYSFIFINKMEIEEVESSHTELESEPLHAEMESITSYFMEYDPLLDDGVLPEEQSEYNLNDPWWGIYD